MEKSVFVSMSQTYVCVAQYIQMIAKQQKQIGIIHKSFIFPSNQIVHGSKLLTDQRFSFDFTTVK